MRPPSTRSAPGPRALPSVLAGATTAVAAGTLAGWLLPSLAGWGMGAAIAGLSAVAAFAPSLRRPLVCGASALCVLASLPYLAAMLGMGRGCTGFQVPTAVRSACVLAMVTTAGLMLLPVVRERLPGGDGEFLGVGWFGATAALATICFGGGPAIFHRGAAGAVLMVLLAAVMGVVVGAGPAAAACLSGIEMVVLVTGALLSAPATTTGSGEVAGIEQGECLLPCTQWGPILGFGLALVLAHAAARLLGGLLPWR